MANLKLYLVIENRKHVAPGLCVDLLCSLVRRNKMDALGAQPFLNQPQEDEAASSRPNTAVAVLSPPASDSHRARHHPAPPPSWLLPRFARRRQDPGSFRGLRPLPPGRVLQAQGSLLFRDSQTGATRPGARKTASPSVTPPSRRPRPSRGARPELPCRVLTPWLKPLRGAAAEPGAAAAAAKANAAAGTAASNTPWWHRTCGSGGGTGRTARKRLHLRLGGRWPIWFAVCGASLVVSWTTGSKRSHVSSNVAKSSSGIVSRSSKLNRESKSNSLRSIFSTIQSVPVKASSARVKRNETNSARCTR